MVEVGGNLTGRKCDKRKTVGERMWVGRDGERTVRKLYAFWG